MALTLAAVAGTGSVLAPAAQAAPTAAVHADSASVAAVTPLRSVKVNVANASRLSLFNPSWSLSHGIWSSGQELPYTIGSNGGYTVASWQTESQGFATGTEGQAVYSMEGGGTLTIRWNNPFSGSNSYGCDAPAGRSCSWEGGGGKNATVLFKIA
ncbi:hypothetical protein OHV05_34960 [Kitasatospora sp. NBC_00070]